MVLRFSFAALALGVVGFAACGDGESAGEKGPSSSGTGGSGGEAASLCPAGQIPVEGGACETVGIAACAPIFLEEDGFCRPSADKCEPGTMPKFDEGCIAVGIPDCAKVFLEDDGFCHPAMAKCGEGTFAVPQDGCVPIDGPEGCGSGTWGAIPDGADNIYVDAAYAGGDGDGSKEKPFVTIAEAVAVVVEGGRIAIAEGQYTEPLLLERSVEIAGRCPSKVTIDGSDNDADFPSVIHVTAGDVRVSGVRLSGFGLGMRVQGNDADVTAEHVLVEDAVSGGFFAESGAHLSVSSSLVQKSWWFDDWIEVSGGGIVASSGATASVEKSAFYDNEGFGAAVLSDDTHFTATNTLFEKSEFEGVQFWGGPSGTLEAVAIVHHRWGGLTADAASVTMAHSLVDDIYGDWPFSGIAVEAYATPILDFETGETHPPGPCTVSVSDSALLRTGGSAVSATDEGTAVDIARTMALGSTPSGAPFFEVVDGAEATITDVALVGGHVAGLAAMTLSPKSAKTKVTAKGLLVQDVLHINSLGDAGEGILAYGAPLSMLLDAVFVDRAHTAGLLAHTDGDVTVRHSLFSNTKPGNAIHGQSMAKGTADCIVVEGAHVVIETTRVEGCPRAGLLLDRCQGSLRLSSCSKNKFGAVLQGTNKPTVDAFSTFDGNASEGLVTDTKIATPPPPAIVPSH